MPSPPADCAASPKVLNRPAAWSSCPPDQRFVSPDPMTEPSREVLARVFPSRDGSDSAVESIYKYVDLLTSVGIQRGLLGPREANRIWDRHVLNCAVIAPVFGRDLTVCDLGS